MNLLARLARIWRSGAPDGLPLKTTSYYLDSSDGMMLAQRGSLWAISIDTADGTVEFEMTPDAACAVRDFFDDAICAKCKADRPEEA